MESTRRAPWSIRLGDRERAVLAALVDNSERVVDRDRLRRDAGLTELSARRCDARS